MKSKRREAKSSSMSKRSTEKGEKSSSMSKRSTESGEKSSSMSKRSTENGKKSSSDEIYKKYNINERLIELIDGDEKKIKILLKEIYKKKQEELKELRMTPYTKENK
jgi:hypothetical protein